MLTPKQTAETLRVSTSTLRRWSIEFSAFLTTRKGVRRLYSVDDLAMLKQVKDWFNEGLNTDQIRDALPHLDRAKTDTALVNLKDFASALSLAMAENAKLTAKVDNMDKRLEALEAWIMSPWYKRIGKHPPIK